MLNDPRVNFAIQTRSANKGIDHLGIQVEDEAELTEVFGCLRGANGRMIEEGRTTCGYAQSEKTWVFDPVGVAWETFYSIDESPVYGTDPDLATSMASEVQR